jgi:PAS domain S-box-containing protein
VANHAETPHGSDDARREGKRVGRQTVSPAQAAPHTPDLAPRQSDLQRENEELRHALAELEAVRDLYADLYDYAPIAYITTGADGAIVAANLTAADLLRVERDELVGAPIADFVARHDQGTLSSHRQQVRRYGFLKNCKLTMVKASGDTFPAQLDSVVSPGATGGFDHCRTVITDATEHVRMDQALAQMRHRESLEVLAAGIAHDFNNLLTSVMAAHSLATMDLKSPEHLPVHFHVMSEGLEAIRDLVHQLLTLSSATPSDKTAVTISNLVETSCRLAPTADNVAYDFALGAQLWRVMANEPMISRAIQHLLTNAGEAMPNGGLIRITAENTVLLPGQLIGLQPGRYVRISVADAGPGIPEAHLTRVFDPYFSTKEQGAQRGMGLGLAVSHAIVKEHGGVITVDSRVGAGTTFHLYLPAPPNTNKPARKEKRRQGKLLTGIGRILVMDDQDIVRTAACSMLSELGYMPVAACDVAQAVGAYRDALETGERFAAVIVDLTTPDGVGGKEAIKELAKIDPTVVAIVSSGFVDDPVMTDFAHYGFRGALPKPYYPAELGQVLHAAVHGD